MPRFAASGTNRRLAAQAVASALAASTLLAAAAVARAQTNPFTGEPMPSGSPQQPPASPPPTPDAAATTPPPTGAPEAAQPAPPAAGVPPPPAPPAVPSAAGAPAPPVPNSGYPYPYPPPWAPPPPQDPRPKYLPYHPGEAAPAGYVYDERARRGPIIGGLITFAVPYSLSLLVAAQDSANKKTWLLMPGFGPWITLLARDSSCDPSLPIHDCTEDSATRMVLVIDGILQTGGLIMAAAGLLNPNKRYVRSDWAPQIAVMPRLLGKAPALGVSGSF